MAEITKDISHEFERGVMLRVLVSWNLEWMPFRELRVQSVSRLGYILSDEEVRFQLNYLIQSGYAESKTLRAGRTDFELAVVRATAKAVDLAEARTADPGIAL